MTQTTTTQNPSTAGQPGIARPESVLPELRATWWETGVRARAEAGVFTVFAELPGLSGPLWASVGVQTGCVRAWWR